MPTGDADWLALTPESWLEMDGHDRSVAAVSSRILNQLSHHLRALGYEPAIVAHE